MRAPDIEPVLDDVLAERRRRTSKRSLGFPGNHYGAASSGRTVTGKDVPASWQPGDPLPAADEGRPRRRPDAEAA